VSVLLWIGVLLCGGFGAVARILVDGTVSRRATSGLPYGTLIVNLSGAALLGLLDGLVLPTGAALLVGTGVIGAYTTFSTWMLETQRLVEEHRYAHAMANIVVSVVVGIGAATLGLWIGGEL
jgi:fluoride exporter